MTTYLDYSANPVENNGPPPVGAPENHPTSQVNNIAREMMSVIRQLGDAFTAQVDLLGTLSTQDADAVAITGGTITANLNGPGSGITNLKAQNLIEGPIPAAVFPADAAPLNVKVARAVTADSLTSSLAILPVGAVMLWYGLLASVPAGWHVCDGTSGTPDLRGRFALGVDATHAMGAQGGVLGPVTGSATGGHDHGAKTGGHALTVAEMAVHGHPWLHTAPSPNLTTNFFTPNGGIMTRDTPGSMVTQSYDQAADGTNGQQIGGAGGGAVHDHPITAVADHTHSVDITPAYTALYYIMRIA